MGFIEKYGINQTIIIEQKNIFMVKLKPYILDFLFIHLYFLQFEMGYPVAPFMRHNLSIKSNIMMMVIQIVNSGIVDNIHGTE